MEKIVVLGLGLIGGSLARSLRRAGFCREVHAWGHRDVSLKKGVDQGVIDAYSLDLSEALDGADMVVIATPVLTACELLPELVARAAPETVLTDVASVKGSLARAYGDACRGKTNPPPFVPAHPIAGSERSGVDASDADLFRDHRVILTPTSETDPDALAQVRALWESTGAEVVELGVEEHDAILAATSHLPHILAYALVDALSRSKRPQSERSGSNRPTSRAPGSSESKCNESGGSESKGEGSKGKVSHGEPAEDIFRFAAGGFRDFTRIASSDPVMWRDICLANRDALLAAIDHFGVHLASLRRAIEEGDAETLRQTFADAKTTRDALPLTKKAGGATSIGTMSRSGQPGGTTSRDNPPGGTTSRNKEPRNKQSDSVKADKNREQT